MRTASSRPTADAPYGSADADAAVVGLVGDSLLIRELLRSLARVASVNSTVLLQGESGTGKELAARALHKLGPRAQGRFVPVNCATMSPELMEIEFFGHAKGAFTGATRAREGLFCYAQSGTLFLDEVADLPLPLQALLLRALDERVIRPLGSEKLLPVNVRIVTASNRSLTEAVAKGLFRKDLYYRLQVVEITMPPLREHKEDIALLVQHFMQQLAPALGVEPLPVTTSDLDSLTQYDWPGNVRELRNLIERSLILGALNVSALYPVGLAPKALAGALASEAVPTTDLQTLEKQHILAILETVQGDKTQAARLLGISRRTLERRCAAWAGQA